VLTAKHIKGDYTQKIERFTIKHKHNVHAVISFGKVPYSNIAIIHLSCINLIRVVLYTQCFWPYSAAGNETFGRGHEF